MSTYPCLYWCGYKIFKYYKLYNQELKPVPDLQKPWLLQQTALYLVAYKGCLYLGSLSSLADIQLLIRLDMGSSGHTWTNLTRPSGDCSADTGQQW